MRRLRLRPLQHEWCEQRRTGPNSAEHAEQRKKQAISFLLSLSALQPLTHPPPTPPTHNPTSHSPAHRTPLPRPPRCRRPHRLPPHTADGTSATASRADATLATATLAPPPSRRSASTPSPTTEHRVEPRLQPNQPRSPHAHHRRQLEPLSLESPPSPAPPHPPPPSPLRTPTRLRRTSATPSQPEPPPRRGRFPYRALIAPLSHPYPAPLYPSRLPLFRAFASASTFFLAFFRLFGPLFPSPLSFYPFFCVTQNQHPSILSPTT